MNFKQYIEHISKLPSGKPVYCYSYITKLHYRLSSISQISILFGISYINIGKKLFTNSKSIVYTGGYLFSGCIITKKDIKNISSEEALTERNKIWEKLSIDNKVVPSGTLKMGLKRNGIPHITMGEDIVSSIDKIAL